MKKWSYRHWMTAGVAAVFLLSCFMPASAIAGKKRALWSCYDVGASGYTQASSIADAMLKKYGTRVRLIPSGTGIGRLMPVVTRRSMRGIMWYLMDLVAPMRTETHCLSFGNRFLVQV